VIPHSYVCERSRVKFSFHCDRITSTDVREETARLRCTQHDSGITVQFMNGTAGPCHSPGFPPRRPGFDPKSGHVGFVVDNVTLGQVLSQCFSFPCQFSFHRLLHTHHLSSAAVTTGQTIADVPSGLSLTSPQETKKILVQHLLDSPCRSFWEPDQICFFTGA
jgi:hypothetical protein